MGLFDQIINAIENSNQEASSGQLATILSTMEQMGDSYHDGEVDIADAIQMAGRYLSR